MKKVTGICLFLLCVLVVCGFSFTVGYSVSHNHGIKKMNEIQILDDKRVEEFNIEDSFRYILYENDGYVTVYLSDGTTLYSNTGIIMDELSKELQAEIKIGKKISSEEALYNFLESYSS